MKDNKRKFKYLYKCNNFEPYNFSDWFIFCLCRRISIRIIWNDKAGLNRTHFFDVFVNTSVYKQCSSRISFKLFTFINIFMRTRRIANGHFTFRFVLFHIHMQFIFQDIVRKFRVN